MKPTHLMLFDLAWGVALLVGALYQGFIKCQKRQNRPLDFKALTLDIHHQQLTKNYS